MNIQPLTQDLVLDSGLVTFDGYASYPLLSSDMRLNLLRDRANSLSIGEGATCLAAISGSQVQGLIALRRFPWGETHFHMGMAHIELFAIHSQLSRKDAQLVRMELFESAMNWIKKHGIQHLAARIDASDQETVHFLEAHEFRLMDTLVTYIYNSKRYRRVSAARHIFPVREFQASDEEAVLRLASGSFEETRFARDIHISRSGLNRFYEDWGRRLCAGEMADRLIVACNRHAEVVGFLGYRLDQQLFASTGLRARGGGLGAVHPRATGAYLAMIHEAFATDHTQTDFAELDGDIRTFSVIKIWNKLKCQQVRVRHTLHAWLGK
ncbi:MAG: hypothetical protein KDC35_00765 [Acidobacteria bacterium]|nr:hypothetical protein [Acidobacteriota bacterium]